MLNIDQIFKTLNDHQVDYLLIGGMNFFLRHRPDATFDVDIWIEGSPANRARCEAALIALRASWGRTEEDWKPVRERPAGWLDGASVFCLVTAHGDLDVFLSVKGLGSWSESRRHAIPGATGAGVTYLGISDADMIACQQVLPEGERHQDRVSFLQRRLADGNA